jgi:methionyl-tRNA formyltransferase
LTTDRPLRIVFMGTPAFAVPTFEALLDLGTVDGRPAQVVGAVTQPDRPAGRGQRLVSPPVKDVALAAGVSVLQPERLRRPEGIAALEALAPDLIVVAAYAQILSQRVLDLPPHGCLNVHASLLPRYRGAAPIQAAILDGMSETGVSIMLMEAGLDTGPVLSQVHIGLRDDDTAGTLTQTLSMAGAELLAATLPGWISGTVVPQPQEDALATMTRPLRKEDGRIDWSQPAARIARQVRAMQPWPGAFTTIGEAPLKVFKAVPIDVQGAAPPGTMLDIGGTPAVATADRAVLLQQVQPAGRRPMSGGDWLRGSGAAFRGAVLGTDPGK